MREFTPAAMVCPRTEWDKLVRHVCQSYPEEGCGILLGEDMAESGATDLRLRLALPASNVWGVPEERGKRFVIPPQEIILADRLAAYLGWQIIGFYHSHPNQPATPSAFDADAAWAGTLMLILSVYDQQLVDAQAWWKAQEVARFVPVPIRQPD